MSNVAIITDSTSNISQSMLNGHHIEVSPLTFIWGENTYRDGIDITPSQFYKLLKTSKIIPTTSQVTPEAFKILYKKLLDSGHEILGMFISSRLSGTLDSAIQARNAFPGAPIELVDSETTSMALGFQVLAVARAANQGATLSECKIIAEQARAISGALFVVKTLEFLHRGGRIGGAAAFLGTALNLKPILEIRDGRIEAVERVRTMSKATERMIELFEDRIGKRTPVRVSVLHADADEEAKALLERIRQRINVTDLSDALITEVSPVLGTHTGPGVLGIGYMAGM
jgi:DegV family protein with EDD domain